ncbi:fumarylacetoacetate hydrolase family protein [Chelatococcus asaccharovorans]|uniref:2-keto-4-pentenoate hydratase/2-oxohepta-3-ene-1,7-dioic acid hydratase in catechol pathway n=1 Tax=Chelatococcus asaccharovorans TaxID=28210 RepID=A0A2V3TV18_9HYPH|nr:fumarylacetoacetate hydrolase family protein [Chelatococcus asaccharovorans]MBS7704959.1 fumarylacetoacetate hydrolase family protein [Chelatococcus asaccharovorans]PXW51873.1 2-keto-4-pentenoate hydratase/2-oxohepta-3-ene-1,7-dioic acid hydratase in catechol pathway [Chelatococcus asaccharovorans]
MWALTTAELATGPTACLVVDGALHPLVELAAAHGVALPDTVAAVFADWARCEPVLAKLAADVADGRPASEATLLAPLRYPGKILCAGANYYDHMAEMGFPGITKESQRLFFFMKPPRNAIVGPGATVLMPRGTQAFDWEVELAAVIGRTARHVSVDEALSHIAGYTVAIDFSARDFNKAPEQFYKLDWVAGKANDTCCPIGPWIVPAAHFPHPQSARLRLSVNGELKQDGSADQMIFSIAEQVARASEIMTLDPGDLLLTGTPAGVGVPKQTFLKVGDRVDAEIEGIGKLSVTIAGEA